MIGLNPQFCRSAIFKKPTQSTKLASTLTQLAMAGRVISTHVPVIDVGQCLERRQWASNCHAPILAEGQRSPLVDLEITTRKPGTRGFTPILKRWTVERTYGWLMLHRHLARD